MDEQEVKLEQKPLSKNKAAAFFQRIYRWWLGVWYGFAQKHPKLSPWIYKIAFFFIFSMGVTILQYIGFILLPYVFGIKLAGTEWFWPHIKMATINGKDLYWNILGYNVSYNDAGEVIIGGGLGYFIAYELTTFLAQCINFPLQRNITYRSHGNPWFQAMWYFIGWVLISLFCNAINGLWMPFAEIFVPSAVYNILVTFVTGGVSMVIFFFIFLIIFPNVDKDEKSKTEKAEKAKAKYEADASDEKAKAAYEKAQLTATKATETRKVYYAESAISKASSFAETKIAAYLAVQKKQAKGKASEEDLAQAKEQATAAVIERDKILPEQNAILEEVKAARASRAAA